MKHTPRLTPSLCVRCTQERPNAYSLTGYTFDATSVCDNCKRHTETALVRIERAS